MRSNNKYYLFLFLSAAITIYSCSVDPEIKSDDLNYVLKIPAGFPYPEIPVDNPLTQEKIDLGKKLFYDPILSVDSTISCGSCHKQELGFSDNIAISEGVNGLTGFRNSPSLAGRPSSRVPDRAARPETPRQTDIRPADADGVGYVL